MAFCEQCGARLTPGTRFCEECGAAVASEAHDAVSTDTVCGASDFKSIFRSSEWDAAWRRVASDAGDCELGLIVTRENALLSQIDAPASAFHALIADYVDSAAKRGVRYCYLNLDEFPDFEGNGFVGSVVSALRRIVDVARPKYMFILGNEEIINVARWENRAGDGDEEVESDLCYTTLDCESPWEGQEYDFDEAIRVGRLPTYASEGFDNFKAYFDNAALHIGKMDRLIPYGLSALVWEEETNYEFGQIASRQVDVSPLVGKANVAAHMGSESNLFFFNLHGSGQTRYWYGQEGCDYPEAFSPSVLRQMDRPYFLGVEACYGARYLDGLTPEDSIVLTAMQRHCIAFLGSSRIAFGTSSPTGSCADFVVGSFVKAINQGESAGDAHVAGLKRLTDDSELMDDADIKTMAEFALYGDPSARKGANASAKGLRGLFASGSKVRKGLSVPMPDIRRAIRLAVVEVDAKIEAIVDDYVKREVLPELAGAIGAGRVQSKTVKMTKSGLNQKIYSFKDGVLRRVAKVYFDDKGCVRKALVSK